MADGDVILSTERGGPILVACRHGGFQQAEKLFFRDTAISINSPSDGVLRITADTELELNAPSVKVYDCVVTVGAFVASTDLINVVIQLNQGDNATAVAEAIAFQMYLSSDAAGQTVDAAPSGGFAAGTDGTIILEHTANIYAQCLTEADGDFDLIVTDTASASTYVNVILPSGQLITSSILTFT